VSGSDITSKDFRTWAATVAAALALQIEGQVAGVTRLKKCVVRAVEQTAHILGNTPAVCRRAYIHPAVLESYLAGELCDRLAECRRMTRSSVRSRGLDPEERVVLQFLRRSRDRVVLAVTRGAAA
jgi:DNA topoisomerase-1